MEPPCGVALDDVDPRTLESKRHSGLFLCGEMLDAFGPIGGHNFAWAWSTGRAAGLGAANLDLIGDIIACPGLDYCSLANARSIPVAQKIATRFALRLRFANSASSFAASATRQDDTGTTVWIAFP